MDCEHTSALGAQQLDGAEGLVSKFAGEIGCHSEQKDRIELRHFADRIPKCLISYPHEHVRGTTILFTR